jgi:hypothetical protein
MVTAISDVNVDVCDFLRNRGGRGDLRSLTRGQSCNDAAEGGV